MATTTSSAPGPPSAVVAALRCPLCEAEFTPGQDALRCARGHAFDLARQGYVNLLHAKVPADTADTAEMVAARAEFLDAGFYAPLADALAARSSGRLVLDAGAGTGYYLARVLRSLPEATGLALDLSARAVRRAARAHPRAGGAVWNVWWPWPVRSGVADVVLDVFAPRHVDEFHRVLRDDGTLLVVVPGEEHLRELTELFGLLAPDEHKLDRLDSATRGRFALTDRVRVGGPVTLPPDDARRAVLMGPNAHHLHRDDLGARLAGLSTPVTVTTSFTVSAYRKVRP
nr:methyltransferase domain-containing protein [Saccharomonospora saliphila]